MPRMKLLAASLCWLSLAGGCAMAPAPEKQALEVRPLERVSHGTTSPALYELGRYHQAQGRYAEAAAAYREALAQDPRHVQARNAQGIVLSLVGRHEEAVQELQAAIAQEPKAAYLHNNLGYAYLLQGRGDEAAAALARAELLDPSSQRVAANLRLANRKGPDKTEAAANRGIGSTGIAEARAVVPAPTDRAHIVHVAPGVYELKVPAASPPRQIEIKPFHFEVANGNGVQGMARRVAGHLSERGLPKARVSNQKPFNQHTTVVQYRPGYRAEADLVGSRLPQKAELVMADNLASDVQIRLVLGRDLTPHMAAFQGQERKILVALK